MKFIKTALAASLLGLASASYANVVDVSKIKITSTETGNGNGWIQIAEVIALNESFNNVSFSGASSAGVYQNNDANWGANFAIDGNVSHTGHTGFYHSKTTGSSEYLQLDFGSATELSSITIFGRNNCCQSRDVFNVQLLDASDNVLFSADALDAQYHATAPFSNKNFVTLDLSQVSAVPEPSTYAMMIGGLGLIGLLASRRKKA